MTEFITTTLDMTLADSLTTVCVVLLASIVRGFAGFGLSALTMAGLTVTIPPAKLIPVCLLLEAVASLTMFQGGFRNANHTVAWGLATTSAIGVPIGLAITVTISTDLSKVLALSLIVCLVLFQLTNLKPKWLNSKPGLYGTGLLAGFVTGIATVGGMVVALYILTLNTEPVKMRSSLVMFLCLSMFTSFFG